MDASISGSMVAALEQAWAAIRDRHPDVPPAVIVLAPGSVGGRRGELLGHFGPLRWQRASAVAAPESGDRSGAVARSEAEADSWLSEVLISGEGLRHGPREVLDTLLHEAAHAVAHVRGVRDTSRQGRWHNSRYASLAAELGLDAVQAPGIGWSDTSLRPETHHEYADVLALLGRTLTLHRRPEVRGGRGARSSSNNPLPCECRCPRRIRVAPSSLAAGPILCGVCQEDFRPV